MTFAALAKTGSALGRRQKAIAQNIANVNTPGYKRRDVDFKAELANALSTSGSRSARADAVLDTVARDVVEEQLFYRADMGGVDIDREMAELAKTSLLGSAVNQLLTNKIRSYRSVIKEGRL